MKEKVSFPLQLTPRAAVFHHEPETGSEHEDMLHGAHPKLTPCRSEAQIWTKETTNGKLDLLEDVLRELEHSNTRAEVGDVISHTVSLVFDGVWDATQRFYIAGAQMREVIVLLVRDNGSVWWNAQAMKDNCRSRVREYQQTMLWLRWWKVAEEEFFFNPEAGTFVC